MILKFEILKSLVYEMMPFVNTTMNDKSNKFDNDCTILIFRPIMTLFQIWWITILASWNRKVSRENSNLNIITLYDYYIHLVWHKCIILDPPILAFSGFNDEITEQLEILDKKDVRIILGNFNETWAR